MQRELALVMPVYNEEECIVEVVRSWSDMLRGLGIDFRMIVLNDGSRDNTGERLGEFLQDQSICVVDKPNSGHGPTILCGYRQAVRDAEWVFQCDSDDEMKPDSFAQLWQRREDYDALFGYRHGRQQGLGRKIISVCSRATVRVFFTKGVTDVNTPYRLVRSAILRQIIEKIPDNTFAPNVIISGAIARAGLRICNLAVPFQPRRTGTVSIVKWKLWKAAFRSFRQTLWCRPTIDPSPVVPDASEPESRAD